MALAHRHRSHELPPVLQRGLDEFLGDYGHRAVAEIDVGLPRWSDDPIHVIGVLANYLRLDDASLAPDAQFARGGRAARWRSPRWSGGFGAAAGCAPSACASRWTGSENWSECGSCTRTTWCVCWPMSGSS
ncbi:MAG: hypothetical protein ACRDSP_04870 [Pseudonocardiaceae bacterium]